MVKNAGEYQWSSYRAMTGEEPSPEWLATDELLLQFSKQRAAARRRYIKFVENGLSRESIWSNLRQQIYLGDDQFIDRIQSQVKVEGDELSIPKVQLRKPAETLESITRKYPDRNEAIIEAYATGVYSYREIADYHVTMRELPPKSPIKNTFFMRYLMCLSQHSVYFKQAVFIWGG